MVYTQQQIECAQEARRLYNIIGNTATENYKYLLRQSVIKNCLVKIDDVNLTEKIFGTDIVSIKG